VIAESVTTKVPAVGEWGMLLMLIVLTGLPAAS